MNHILSQSILNKTKRRDPWFLDDYTINPYSGCSFNCLFCYIRGSKYGEHMERTLAVKDNAIELLDKELGRRAKKNQYGIIVVSSATEPYLQFEEELQMTRKILERILHYRFPVHIITRSDLVVRDFDILKEINQQAILPPDLEGKLPAKAFISFSFSTLDNDVAKIFEPGATPPSRRIQTLKETLDAGFYSGVSLMPLLPFISDSDEELEKFYTTFKGLGVKYIMPASIALYGEGPAHSKTLVMRAIQKHYKELYDGYDAIFGRQLFLPQYQNIIKRRIEEVRKKYNIPDKILPSR
ncbi:MAG: radical SAM protein, partial [Bacteroidota bacterium]